MKFEIKDKKLLLDIIQSSIDYYYETKQKGPVIFAKVPSDLIERNFKKVWLEMEISPRVVDAWISAIPVGSSSMDGHKHDNDVWVYYLNAPKNCGELIILEQGVEYEPEVNDIVVIPKGQTHKIDENRSDGFRISLAMELAM